VTPGGASPFTHTHTHTHTSRMCCVYRVTETQSIQPGLSDTLTVHGYTPKNTVKAE